MNKQVFLFSELSQDAKNKAIQAVRNSDQYGKNWRDEPMQDMKSLIEGLGFTDVQLSCTDLMWGYNVGADMTAKFDSTKVTQQGIQNAQDFLCDSTGDMMTALLKDLGKQSITAEIVGGKIKDLDVNPLLSQMQAIDKKLEDAQWGYGDYSAVEASQAEIDQLERQSMTIYKTYCLASNKANNALQDMVAHLIDHVFSRLYGEWEMTFSDEEISEHLMSIEQKFDVFGDVAIDDYADCFS